jgi:hypothetical protein
MGQLHNRIALITGAGRGIGQAIALAYATHEAETGEPPRHRASRRQDRHGRLAYGAAAYQGYHPRDHALPLAERPQSTAAPWPSPSPAPSLRGVRVDWAIIQSHDAQDVWANRLRDIWAGPPEDAAGHGP